MRQSDQKPRHAYNALHRHSHGYRCKVWFQVSVCKLLEARVKHQKCSSNIFELLIFRKFCVSFVGSLLFWEGGGATAKFPYGGLYVRVLIPPFGLCTNPVFKMGVWFEVVLINSRQSQCHCTNLSVSPRCLHKLGLQQVRVWLSSIKHTLRTPRSLQ